MEGCTACGSPETRRDPFYYEWEGRRHWVRRCRRCTHQFVHPPITPEQQARMYSDAYFSEGGDWVCGLFAGSGYRDAEEELRREAHEILGMIGRACGRLLDVGCAGGVFLDVAREHGFEVQGLELNESMAQHARGTYGLDVLRSRIEDVPESQWAGCFDVVTVLDVMEHLPAPLGAMRRIGRWAKPGASVLVRGPLVNRWRTRAKEAARRLLGRPKQLPGYPLDANAFNVRSMSAMLRLSGIEPVQWWHHPDFANLLAVKR